MDTTYQIKAPHFVAAIVLADYHVIEAAPIVYYMRDWTLEQVQIYCVHKGWTCDKVS